METPKSSYHITGESKEQIAGSAIVRQMQSGASR